MRRSFLAFSLVPELTKLPLPSLRVSAFVATILAGAACGPPPPDLRSALGSVNQTLLDGRLRPEDLDLPWVLYPADDRSDARSVSLSGGRVEPTDGSEPGLAIDGARVAWSDPSTLEIAGSPWTYDGDRDCLLHDDLCLAPRVDDVLLRRLGDFEGWEVLSFVDEAGVTDAGIVHLTGFCASLASLRLDATAITDEGARRLAACTSLTRLSLARTAVTDAGVLGLVGLTGLEHLTLPHGVTGAGLAPLAGLSRLRVLRLRGADVTDETLGHVAAFPELQTLDLSGTQVTNAAMIQLIPLRKLRALHVPDGVNGEAVKYLATLPELSRLTMDGKLNHHHLRYLRKMPALRGLAIADVPEALTDEEIEAFREERPELRIQKGSNL